MSQPFVAEIKMFGGNFAPRGYAFCNGQLLPISQNTALFSLLGTTYGGNGQSTFGLPNLQGRIPLGAGNGPGLTPRSLGESGGAASVTLTSVQIPSHTHSALGANVLSNQASPSGAAWTGNAIKPYAATANATLSPTALASAGGGQPHNNLPPYQVVNFIIALQGIFPARN